MEKHLEKLKKALKKDEAIVFSSNCEVNYTGRAESHLPEGDRLIMIKPDKTILIHQPSGSAPVNYMKANTQHSVVKDDSGTYLKCTNLKETLKVKLNNIHFMNSKKLEDGHKINLAGSEKDMSDHIYDNPELIEKGFKPLCREEHTKYGFIDVFGYDKNQNLVVVECKRYKADFQTVSQLRRYVEKIKNSKGLSRVRGIIAAPKITENAAKMAHDWGFSFVKVQPPKRLEVRKDQKKLVDY